MIGIAAAFGKQNRDSSTHQQSGLKKRMAPRATCGLRPIIKSERNRHQHRPRPESDRHATEARPEC